MTTRFQKGVLMLGFIATLFATGCKSTTTIVLVRHAEREPITATNPDPPLTAAGQQRAQALIGVVERANVSAIYTTQLQRTIQTAAPLAGSLSMTPTVFNLGGNVQQHAQDLAADILAAHRGKAVLVIGHSDTVPLVIESLGVVPGPTIATSEFDRLFIVVKHQDGATRLITGKYGP